MFKALQVGDENNLIMNGEIAALISTRFGCAIQPTFTPYRRGDLNPNDRTTSWIG